MPRSTTTANRVLVAAVLLLVFGVALIDVAARLVAPAGTPFAVGPDLQVGRGEDAREAALLAGSVVTRAVRPWFDLVEFACFRATPDLVIATDAGWLFYAEGLAAPREPATTDLLTRRVGFVREVADVAARAGVPTVVWLVPAKWRACADRAPGLVVPAGRRELYQRVRAALLAAGLVAPDLVAGLAADEASAPPAWRCDDTHLAEDGYARVVERWLPPALGLDPGRVRERLAAAPKGAPTVVAGDLRRLLDLPAAFADPFAVVTRSWLLPAAHDAPGSDVIMVGDSNLRVWDGLLPRLVQAAGAVTVDSRYAETAARGLGRAWEEYAGRSPRLVLMVLAERGFATSW